MWSGNMYIYGGYTQTGISEDLYQYVSLLTLLTLLTLIILLTLLTEPASPIIRLFRYTVATGVWKRLPSATISLPRVLHNAAVLPGSSIMSIFGGNP
jgi:hypothetical protein